jgi:hypothetical protein
MEGVIVVLLRAVDDMACGSSERQTAAMLTPIAERASEGDISGGTPEVTSFGTSRPGL